jgi:hypothetical protein
LELADAAQFHDWGTRQILDSAEMTAAFAIAYDWLYDAWTPEQRQIIRQSIINLGLKPALTAYATQKWPHQVDNHNTVGNGGLALGALAIADEAPDIAGKILALGLVSVRNSLSQFAPDGAWPEGPMYWGYATEYEAMYLDSLETACGTDFGLGDIPGVDKAGWFPLYDNGPADGAFNYADADEDHEIRSGPQLLWMSRRFHDPRFAQYEIDHPNGRVSALDVIWGAGIDRGRPSRPTVISAEWNWPPCATDGTNPMDGSLPSKPAQITSATPIWMSAPLSSKTKAYDGQSHSARIIPTCPAIPMTTVVNDGPITVCARKVTTRSSSIRARAPIRIAWAPAKSPASPAHRRAWN